MKFAVSPLIRQVHFPPISEVQGWLRDCQANAPKPLFDLCQAVPDYPPAGPLIEYLQSRLTDPTVARYSPDEGLPEVRNAICHHYRQRYAARIDPSQLCLSIGASQAFWLAMMVLCREGDEVIVQTPYYFDHAMALQGMGVEARLTPFVEDRCGLPDVATIAAMITPRTKAILVVTPSNPTGTVCSAPLIEELYQLAKANGLALILDETYQAFLPRHAPPHNLFSRPDWGDHFVHLASFGKTYSLTGYRAGMLVASAAFIHEALKVQDTMAVCQPRITQLAVAYGVENLSPWVEANRDMMLQRHDRFVAEFDRPDNAFKRVSSGAFFAWVRHPFAGQTGRQVTRMLVEKAGLLVLPGEVFGPGLENYLRLAFGNIRAEDIPAAIDRFCQISP